MKQQEYDVLIGREAAHWRAGTRDENNPQIWDDAGLFEIFFGDTYRRLLRRVEENGPRVLELGCGNGGMALTLAERGLRVTGIDLSPDRIEAAMRGARERRLEGRAVFRVGDLNLMPLPAASFECVVAHDALHHILGLGDLLDRVRRALVPGGRLVVMDYVGMGSIRKVAAAAMFAFLPTARSYRSKWGLRNRLGAFVTTEHRRRAALEKGKPALLHSGSPFEEISGPSIRAEIASRFRIVEYFTFCPFWYYLAPKLRVPGAWRYPVARAFRALDAGMIRMRPRAGAYIFLSATND